MADVRLDNRNELARILDLAQPEILSDAAFLMAAWVRWGESCVDFLVGAFAFAVWRPGAQAVFVARDHTGERPLFFYRGKDFFALASMPKGLLALPDMPRGFKEQRIAEWLGCVHPAGDKGFFAGVECVPAGHLLRISRHTFECRRYWTPAEAAPVRYKRDEEYAEALVEVLDRATEARLRRNGPAGAYLSAGLDSSSVAASAATLLATRDERITVFTAVPRPEFNRLSLPWYLADEGDAAAEIACLYRNMDHQRVHTGGYDLPGTLRRWTEAMDEPVLNGVNAMWATAILTQAKQSGINVMLEGVCGNGTISWETWGILRQMFRGGRWGKLAETIYGLRGNGDISLRAAARASFSGLLPRRWSLWLARVNAQTDAYRTLANAALIERYGLRRRILDNLYPELEDPLAEQVRLYSRFDYGPARVAAFAVTGVEVRDPTADKRVYEFCMGIPQEQYVAEGHSRSLVRRAMRGRLPDSTRLRYTRGYQGADWYLPMSESLDALRQEADALESCAAARDWLDLERMKKLLQDWPTAGFDSKEVSGLWHNALLRGIALGCFLRRWETPGSVGKAT